MNDPFGTCRQAYCSVNRAALHLVILWPQQFWQTASDHFAPNIVSAKPWNTVQDGVIFLNVVKVTEFYLMLTSMTLKRENILADQKSLGNATQSDNLPSVSQVHSFWNASIQWHPLVSRERGVPCFHTSSGPWPGHQLCSGIHVSSSWSWVSASTAEVRLPHLHAPIHPGGGIENAAPIRA